MTETFGADTAPWWHGAVVYQVYLRSFADADGDGIGDLRGLVSRLDYLASLGVDAIWLNPCYASPQRDHGYDIADYFAIAADYGDLNDFDTLVEQARERGIRILMDMVANHCSSDHEWFRAALAAEPGSPERARFHFADGRGAGGALPPTNYQSVFGGGAWSRVTEPDGSLGQWYLHLFDPTQPDLNWANREVVAHFDEMLRFWFDRGVAGFRVDVAHGMAKAPELSDVVDGADTHPAWDQPGVHDIIRRWRSLGDGVPDGPRYWVGEVWVTDAALARYLEPDEFHQAFSFDLLLQPWHAPSLRAAIDRSLALAGDGAGPAWALSNHDVHRVATRYGQAIELGEPDPSDLIAAARRRGPVDLELGLRRSRAAALLQLALPGTVYLFQGEELGLPEVLDMDPSTRQDPIWFRSGGTEFGRDGCRVPLPWSRDRPNLGFSATATAASAWLPQPASFARYCAFDEQEDPGSVFATYAAAVEARKRYFASDEPLRWIEAPPGVLAFRRGGAACVVNVSDEEVESPVRGTVVLSSIPTPAGRIVPDAAVYVELQ
jgi:alpha-glucosidase